MSKLDLLIEVGLEEMPARYIDDAAAQFGEKVEAWLNDKKIAHGEFKLFSTPRRLGILVSSVAAGQEDLYEEAKGPSRKIAFTPDGSWSKAAEGFVRGQGMNVDDIYFKEINGVEYAHVKKFIKGQKTAELLPEMKNLISSLSFPKNMRWANEEMRFIRPIKWIVAIFGENVIPFSIAGVDSGRVSQGHRFLGKPIEIDEPQKYEDLLLAQHVIADSEKRKEAIREQLKKIETEKNWVIPVDEDLLTEVNNLVEYPTALFGTFEEEFLEIPEEVLITSMKEHQRYFPVKSEKDELLPYFITVRNGDHRNLDTVKKGNEKVLKARLSDAAFFYREDKKLEIDAALSKLKNIVYHEEIGTLAEKVERVKELAGRIGMRLSLNGRTLEDAERAAAICKFDLVTQMVYEFPELQGIMGEKYALQKGESAAVARAINEHYMPRHAEDGTAETDAGALLAIAEKLDTIVSFFSIGVIPSGSQDPYALRRQATGVVMTLLNKNWTAPLETLIGLSLELINKAGIAKRGQEEIFSELLAFFSLRVKHLLQDRNIRYDIIDAVIGSGLGSIPGMVEKASVLQEKKEDAGFKENIESLSRVLNIASKAEVMEEIDTELFENQYETNLYEQYIAAAKEEEKLVGAERLYEILASLRPAINDYFDHTMVMSQQEDIKANRLNQMAALATLIMKLAKVNTIQLK